MSPQPLPPTQPDDTVPQDAQHLHRVCAITAMAFGREGDAQFPNAKRGHICIRPATPTDQDALHAMGAQLGLVHSQTRANGMTHWVSLDKPIDGFKWLEITPPKVDVVTGRHYPTGPQMLVYVDENHGGEARIVSARSDASFHLRCQSQSAEKILGLGEQ